MHTNVSSPYSYALANRRRQSQSDVHVQVALCVAIPNLSPIPDTLCVWTVYRDHLYMPDLLHALVHCHTSMYTRTESRLRASVCQAFDHQPCWGLRSASVLHWQWSGVTHCQPSLGCLACVLGLWWISFGDPGRQAVNHLAHLRRPLAGRMALSATLLAVLLLAGSSIGQESLCPVFPPGESSSHPHDISLSCARIIMSIQICV